MIRMSTPEGQDMVAVVDAPIEAALEENSAIIDGYLRKRYNVPLDVAPAEIKRACCILARYDLSVGGNRQAADQTIKDRDGVMAWLKQIAAGQVLLDLQQVAGGDDSYATMRDRSPVYGADNYSSTGWCG